MAAYDDDYRELIEDARDALDALLNRSTHDSWLQLRSSYGDLCRALRLDDLEREKVAAATERDEEAVQRRREEHDEWRERRDREATWKRMPMERRESLLLHALGDERLTVSELSTALRAELGATADRPWIYESRVRSLATRMVAAGQLERAAESFRGKVRYRYFRRRGLDGPIGDLERAYHDGGDA